MATINLHASYKKKISDNKHAIKSLSLISNSEIIKKEIQSLKNENKQLKKDFSLKKKNIYKKSRKEQKMFSLTKKEFRNVLKENKHTYNSAMHAKMQEEYTNMKIKIQNKSASKYRLVYGTSTGRTRNERVSKFSRIGIIIVVLILFLLPFWLIISFSTKTDIDAASTDAFAAFKPSSHGGAQANYELAMKNLDFWKSIFTTLVLTIVSNVLIIVFASMAAWQLARQEKWWSKIIFYTFIIAMILPFQAIMIPLISQFRAFELKGTMLGTIIAYVGFGMALSIFMLHGFLKTIPKALEESAAISGMNPFQIFFKVVLPLLKNTFVTIMVLNIMWIWNDFLLPSLMLDDPYGNQTLQVKLVTSLVSSLSSDLKALSAGVVILVIPPILYFVFAQKKMVAGITNGAIK